MTRKRFIKMAMSLNLDHNAATELAKQSVKQFGSYQRAYYALFDERYRFENYLVTGRGMIINPFRVLGRQTARTAITIETLSNAFRKMDKPFKCAFLGG